MVIQWLCISAHKRPRVFNTNAHLVISWVVLLIPWLLVPELKGQRKFHQLNGLQFDLLCSNCNIIANLMILNKLDLSLDIYAMYEICDPLKK